MDLYNFINTFRILGLLLMPFSLTMLTPIIVAYIYQENTILDFLLATGTTFFIGLFLWFPCRWHHQQLQVRETFLVVTLLWVVLSLTGAFPFTFSENPHIPFVDAFFETVSGLTTTGSTIFSSVDSIPRSILFYRQQLQFIGGGGIIVLGIAILPMLGVGGMQLFRAEYSTPLKEDKLSPRIAQTAKMIWYIYLGLTIACAFCYWLSGLTPFEAIGYSFSTVSTGGFDVRDHNFGRFDSSWPDIVCLAFMIIGAINFSLHFITIQRAQLSHYRKDPECRFFLKIFAFMVLLVTATLIYHNVYTSNGESLLKAAFQVTTFFTTSGFSNATFSTWPTFVPITLAFLGVIGGCAGSTTGGIKIIRLLVLRKQGAREMRRLVHPNGYYIIKIGNNQLNKRTLEAILGFFCVFIATFVIYFLILLSFGLDPLTAFSTLTASLCNTGIGPNLVTGTFQSFSAPLKVLISTAMLAGRLELFTLLILFTPSYWRY